jgi:hypothetical protein
VFGGLWREDTEPLVWSPRLPDLESALPLLVPADKSPICNGGRTRRPSCGVVLEPKGVARRRAGGIGRALTGWPSLEPFTTGLAFGDGGMERPRRGVRAPP